MRGNHATATQSGWRQVDLTLEKLLARGMLTMSDVCEVRATFDDLHRRYQRGEITQHFADLVMRKLAESKVAAWRQRNGMHL